MKFKLESNQIILVLIAFLLGIGITSYLKSDKTTGQVETKTTVEVTGEASEANENMEEPAETATGNGGTTATVTKASNEFVSGACYTSLSGYKDTKLNAIVLNWSPCASEDFQFYKLVKSSKNANPTYPADGVAFSSANKNAANFVDKTVAARTTYYYRMCVVQRLNHVNCSNVATVSF